MGASSPKQFKHTYGSCQKTREFFGQPCLFLARQLLGKRLIRKIDDQRLVVGRIVETEAYITGCRKFRNTHGPGSSFVYGIYGVYCCFNISSMEPGSCVLIRALEPINGKDLMATNRSKKRKSPNSKPIKDTNLCNGPSKLCQALNITKADDDIDLCDDKEDLWLEDGDLVPDEKIVASTRVRVKSDLPYRFYDFGNNNVSVKDKSAEMKKFLS